MPFPRPRSCPLISSTIASSETRSSHHSPRCSGGSKENKVALEISRCLHSFVALCSCWRFWPGSPASSGPPTWSPSRRRPGIDTSPQGKEVDGIYGDFALANDQIIAVVAIPRRGRNANMTVRDVGGCLIDLTRRDRQSDQLSAFYPGAQLRDLKFAGIEVEAPEVYEAAELDRVFVQARRVTLRLVASPARRSPTSRSPTPSRTAGPTCW